MEQTKRKITVTNSPKCYRFKPEAFENHAPPFQGIYELVTFDEQTRPVVVYVGAALETSVREALYGHHEGVRGPTEKEILSRHPNLYFDLVIPDTALDEKTAQEVQRWLVEKVKPEFNNEVWPSSERRCEIVEA